MREKLPWTLIFGHKNYTRNELLEFRENMLNEALEDLQRGPASPDGARNRRETPSPVASNIGKPSERHKRRPLEALGITGTFKPDRVAIEDSGERTLPAKP